MRYLISCVIGFVAVAISLSIPRMLAAEAPAYSEEIRTSYERGAALLDGYQGNADNIRAAEEIFERIIARDPQSPYGHLGMSRLYRLRTHDPVTLRNKALPAGLRALTLGPTIWQVHTNLSHIYRMLGDPRAAESEVREAMRLAPDEGLPHSVYGNVLQEEGRFVEAAAAYEEALKRELTPEARASVLNLLGMLYDSPQLREPAKAIEYYQQALAINDRLPWVHNNLGNAYMNLPDYERAIAALSRALEFMNFRMGRFNLLKAKGHLAKERGDVRQAIRHYEEALLVLPDDYSLRHRLAVIYQKEGDLGKARHHFELAVQVQPTVYDYTNLAMLAEQLDDDHLKQLRYAQQAVQLDPTHAQAQLTAGRACQALGRMDEALGYYRRYLKLEPQGEAADFIRNKFPALRNE